MRIVAHIEVGATAWGLPVRTALFDRDPVDVRSSVMEMLEILTQVNTQTGGPVALALSIVASVLGLAVGYIAFRGYQQNRSLPMLFIATGFLLAFWTPVFLLGSFVGIEVVGEFAPGMADTVDSAFSLASEMSRIIGLLCILYGFRMPLDRE